MNNIHLSAYVRDKETKKPLVIVRDTYPTKAKFYDDLRGNGYAVIRISNNRDLAAQDAGFVSFAEMKKHYQSYYKNKRLFADKIALLEEIAKMPLEKIEQLPL